MFLGISTGLTCVTGVGAAFGGAGGGGGGGGAAATEYWGTWAGELVGKETFHTAPNRMPAMTTTWRPIDTGRVRKRRIPTFCFRDSTTVVSNMVSSSLPPRPSWRG